MARTFRIADIGGTKIVTGEVTGTQVTNLRRALSLPSTAQGAVEFILAGVTSEIAAVGACCAGVISQDDVVEISPNYHALDGFHLGSALAGDDRPARVINDMQAATLGIIALRPDCSYFVNVNWGTGLAAWTAKDGEILCSSEAGHMHYSYLEDAPICGCGRRGHFESVLRAGFIRSKILEIADLRQRNFDNEEAIWGYMYEIIAEDSTFKHPFIDMLAYPMAAFLANLVTLLRPETIFMRGTFGLKTFPRIESRVRELMRDRLIVPDWAQVPILPTPDPRNDALIGVAHYLESVLA